jgi:GNAT superfamily N-acetyltransferase
MPTAFVPLETAHIPEAIALVQAGAEREREHVPALPVDQARDALGNAVTDVVTHGTGVAAIEEGRLTGFLSLYGPIENFFGKSIGVYAPLHGSVAGSATSGEDRARLFSRLFHHAADILVPRGVNCFAITSFAHDHDAATAFSLGGFGTRNCDAIRDLQTPLEFRPVAGYTFRELLPDEFMEIFPLETGLRQHLRSSPVFVAAPELPETEERFLEERTRAARFFAAISEDVTVGYMKVTERGESYISSVAGMPNITGAYLQPEHRGYGIYDSLLAYVIDTLRKEGNRHVGVDFETINPNALHFWSKYFDHYTHSRVRRIDEIEETVR